MTSIMFCYVPLIYLITYYSVDSYIEWKNNNFKLQHLVFYKNSATVSAISRKKWCHRWYRYHYQ